MNLRICDRAGIIPSVFAFHASPRHGACKHSAFRTLETSPSVSIRNPWLEKGFRL